MTQAARSLSPSNGEYIIERHRALREAERRLRAAGIKPHNVPRRDIAALADAIVLERRGGIVVRKSQVSHRFAHLAGSRSWRVQMSGANGGEE